MITRLIDEPVFAAENSSLPPGASCLRRARAGKTGAASVSRCAPSSPSTLRPGGTWPGRR